MYDNPDFYNNFLYFKSLLRTNLFVLYTKKFRQVLEFENKMCLLNLY